MGKTKSDDLSELNPEDFLTVCVCMMCVCMCACMHVCVRETEDVFCEKLHVIILSLLYFG